MAIKLEGGGGKALVARPLLEELFFCGFPNGARKLLAKFFFVNKLHTGLPESLGWPLNYYFRGYPNFVQNIESRQNQLFHFSLRAEINGGA